MEDHDSSALVAGEVAPQLADAPVLLVVPPFAAADRPSLAMHLLQACARRAGIEAAVLYANLHFAAAIGEEAYGTVCYASPYALLGERFFAASAFGRPPLGEHLERLLDPVFLTGSPLAVDQALGAPERLPVDLDQLRRLERRATPWIELLAAAIVDKGYRVVACTTTFEQTAASLALLAAVKRRAPEVITLLGGANCDGEMADGLAALAPEVDYLFAGESERTFPAALAVLLDDGPRPPRIVRGEPTRDLDAVPTPRFEEFYRQHRAWLPDSRRAGELWLSYETSRGCWWGQKSHCTFCGLNGQGITFRAKSPERVLGELADLLPAHPNRKVFVVDNIMPHGYFRDLLPRLAEEHPGLHVFYEQKANLTLEQVLALKRAGVAQIQPGIEALSSSLLARMRKGVTARRNVSLLRYARAAGLAVGWNLLWGFPGDRAEDYEETLALVPLLRHLPPPVGLSHLSIERFSPYFDDPAASGITALRPIGSYAAVFPAAADLDRIAYHFAGDYECGAHAAMPVVRRLAEEVEEWRAVWKRGGARLEVSRMSDTVFLLQDGRGLPGTAQSRVIDRRKAAALLVGAPIPASDDLTWAVEARLVVALDNWYVPLATASPELLLALEAEARGGGSRPATAPATANDSRKRALVAR